MTAENGLHDALIDTARSLCEHGLNHSACGNVSVRCRGGMLITPSGIATDKLQSGDLVFVDLDGRWKEGRQPSSEWLFHRDIYQRRADAGAVLHAHPAWCTTMACMRLDIPSFHYMVAMAGNSRIRCAEYATFGTQELADHALAALAGSKACLLANHGLLCLEKDLQRGLDLAIEVEFLAQVYCQSRVLGVPVLLDEPEMQRVRERFRAYGACKTHADRGA